MREFLRRRLLAIIAAVVVLLLLSANRLATVLTEWWWYRAIDASDVFLGVIQARVILGVVAGIGLAVMIAVSLQVARRLRPLVVPSTPQQAVIETYRARAEPYLKWLILGVAIAFGLSSGFAASTQWEPFLLWQHGGDFGTEDPLFLRDVGHYVFTLPFLHAIQGWLFTSLFLVGLLTVGAHILLGGIRPDAPGDKVVPAVKAHLSVLLALILAARGWGYWLDRYDLNFSERGTVTGAAYTDINAELPALYLLIAVTGVAVVLTMWNLRRRGFLLPGAAIGLLVLASILLQGAYPALVQRLQVDPQELDREREYIDDNLESTRRAYGLDEADLQPFTVQNDLDRGQVDNNEITIDNVRLWDPSILETTYAELQELRTYYAFDDVDVDRYEIDGQLRQVMLSVRELQQTELPVGAQTWQNLALTYTHGLGVVTSQVNVANDQGQPVFLTRNIPTEGREELVPDVQERVYYGETPTPTYSIVNTGQPELDFEESTTSEQVTTQYDGKGGVVIGNRLSRLAFALRFGDPNLVLSSLPNDDSRILYHRTITERVRKVAPYLTLDNDPYPVVHDDRIKWIVDGYTTSENYPYSERRAFQTGSGIEVVNYARNSVKAIVDAYDGTVELFQVDRDDPIITAWRKAFPNRFVDDAPEGLDANFRYPQDLFTLQASLYSIYHIPGAGAFYSRADAWDIPRDPARLQNTPNLSPADAPMEPYYLLMRLPGEEEEEFVLIQPYLARERPNMIAWLAGRSDPGKYGELFAVQFPSNQSVLGPQQAAARIGQDDDIAEYITLRDREEGSQVIRGSLQVIPIEESILYVQPLFIRNEQADFPQLERVVVVLGNRVVMETNLEQAIAAVLGEDVGEVEVPDPEAPDEPDASITEAELIQRALDAYDAARRALEAGDLGEFQRQVDRAQRSIEQLADLRGVDVPEEEPTGEPTEGGTEPAEPTEAAAG